MKPLTLRRALAFQTECTAELRRPKWQEVLRQRFEAAGGDVGRQAAALKLVVVPALCEVVPRYGFDGSYVGVCEALVSLLQIAAEFVEVRGPHRTMAGLMCPPLKDKLPTLDGNWAKACLQRMMCKGSDILAQYLASLFEFVQGSRQYPHKDTGCIPAASAEEPPESCRSCGEVETVEGEARAACDHVTPAVTIDLSSQSSLHGLRPASSKADRKAIHRERFFLNLLQASPSEMEEQSLGGIAPVTLRQVVDVQLNCIFLQMKSMEEEDDAWPEVDQDMLGRVLKGMTPARCLALQEELLARLQNPKFQELARRAYDSNNPVAQLTSHTVLTFPLFAPVLARYGIEVSACGLQVMWLVMLFFKGMKQVEENSARIATLLSVGMAPNPRPGLPRTSSEILQAHEELTVVHENLKAFRAALDAEPVRGASHWICVRRSGLAKTTPDLGSFPKYIGQGRLLQISEALPAPDGSFFLRLEDVRGWVRAAGSSSSGASAADGGTACCVRLAPRAGRQWRVVGGTSLGGIKVRKEKELTSPTLGNSERDIRLETGAKVCELELVGERLHYSKVEGTGPDVGWISIFCKSSALVQVLDWTLDAPEQPAERRDGSGSGEQLAAH